MASHQFREDGSHYNGGAEFFGYGYEAIGEPRLRMVRKWFRQSARRGQTEDSFSVDGQPVPSYAAALEALKSPPTMSEAERAALPLLDDTPARHPEIDIGVRVSLHRKGLASASNGLFAITPAGRAALQNAEGSDHG